jgi:hypothetical protein
MRTICRILFAVMVFAQSAGCIGSELELFESSADVDSSTHALAPKKCSELKATFERNCVAASGYPACTTSSGSSGTTLTCYCDGVLGEPQSTACKADVLEE